MMPVPVSAYIPAFNSAKTIEATIDSLRKQTVAIDELLVIDDGSTDGTSEVAERAGVMVIRLCENSGRGAVRAMAMKQLKHDLVLCCDSSKALNPRFLEAALPWMSREKSAAIVGRVTRATEGSAAARWRNRHLFKLDIKLEEANYHYSLNTSGALMRKSLVLEVGNFNERLTFGEDFELSQRLQQAGYEVAFDPSLEIIDLNINDIPQVLERYWRYNSPNNEGPLTARSAAKLIWYSLKVMIKKDLEANDPKSALISLIAPYYQIYRDLPKDKHR